MRRMIVIAIVSWAACSGRAVAQSEAEVADAGKKYRARCISCHQPPDLAIATDRAWWQHIKTTA